MDGGRFFYRYGFEFYAYTVALATFLSMNCVQLVNSSCRLGWDRDGIGGEGTCAVGSGGSIRLVADA